MALEWKTRWLKAGRCWHFALALIAVCWSPALATGQAQQTDANRAPEAIEADPAEALFPGCAAIKSDAEHERLLKRAAEMVAEQRPDLAAVLWQKIIDETGDALAVDQVIRPAGLSSTPLIVYRPIRERVEQEICRQPGAAIAAYRTSADADARAVLAAATSDLDERPLREVARRFFCSSVGDEAVFKLACLELDRHDFVVASRYLNRLLQHPQSSIPKLEILSRLAIAAAYLHDRELVKQKLSELDAVQIPAERRAFVELIRQEVIKALAREAASTPEATFTGWRMLLGNPARAASMWPVLEANVKGPLTETLVHELAVPAAENTLAQPPPAQRGEEPVAGVLAPAAREELVRQWRDAGWQPTGRLLFDGSRMYAKSANRLLSFGSPNKSDQDWQSAWEFRYELDPLSKQMLMLPRPVEATTLSGPGNPDTRQAIWAFGDRVQQSMSIVDSVIYSLEGPRVTLRPPSPQDRNVAFGAIPRRSRSNWLTAYQTAGGKAIWTRPAADEENATARDVGFLGAPTPCRELLLTPVSDNGTIWLLALDKSTGSTVWKTFLCDEPQTGTSPWAEAVIAVCGDEAYVTCGCGVVFAIDGQTGQVRWAVRYARAERKANPSQSETPNGGARIPRGWDDDVSICDGRLLLVMSSDSDHILALDRRTGTRVWQSPRIAPLGSAASYCLGVNGGALYVAGKNVLRKYELSTGRLTSEQQLSNSLGRGCLTRDSLFVPVGENIERFGLDLTRREVIRVALSRREPIGNLFSDGERLWGSSPGRVFALTPLAARMETLAERITAGDLPARLERARLYERQGRADLMVDDLRAVYRELAAKRSTAEAGGTILEVIAEQRLAVEEPISTLQLLADLLVTQQAREALDQQSRRRLREALAGSLSNIRQQRPAGSVEALLKAAPIYQEDYLLTAAGLALDAVATSNDAPALIRSLNSDDAATRLVSMKSAARLAPGEIKVQLEKRLTDSDDRIRLAAARTLASLGERAGVLETLVALLQSRDLATRSRAHQTLQSLTNERIPFAAEGAADDRAASVERWRQWVSSRGAAAKLNLPLVDRSSRLGRLLIVSPTLLVELDAERKERSRQQLPGAAWGCQGLPDGNRLVAINSHSMVIEYDETGKEVWRKDRLPAPPTSVQRLDNGSTLLACPSANELVTVTPDGTISTLSVLGGPVSAQRLDSGNMLVALQDARRVAEVTSSGLAVWEVMTHGPPSHAVRLENGNTLVTLPQLRKVVEYDVTGKNIVWTSVVPLLNPSATQRLSNGNTLVADHTGIVEIHSSGKEIVWRHRQPQTIGLSAF